MQEFLLLIKLNTSVTLKSGNDIALESQRKNKKIYKHDIATKINIIQNTIG